MWSSVQTMPAGALNVGMMRDVEHFGRLYAERGAAYAHGYCSAQHLIGSICLCCGRAYGLVDSLGSGGGLSHGWCSTACALIGAQRAGVAGREFQLTPH